MMSGRIIHSQFVPAKGLANRHIQTLYQPLFRKVPKLTVRRERIEMPNQDFFEMDWVGEGDGPIVIVLHGMAGSLQSGYATGIMQQIQKRGWRGVIMYYQGTSSGPNRLLTHNHLGETTCLDYLIKILKEREPNTLLAAVGYSMGANLLLKWEGEAGLNNPLVAAVGVSAPFDLRQASNYIRFGFSSFYQFMLLRDIRRYIKEKFFCRYTPEQLREGLENLDNIRSFWHFDEVITAPLHGFVDAIDYYVHSSSRNYLSHIAKPTLIISSLDDPFMPSSVIPDKSELSPTTWLELSEQGGHVGFVAGTMRKPIYWLEQRIPKFLEQYLL